MSTAPITPAQPKWLIQAPDGKVIQFPDQFQQADVEREMGKLYPAPGEATNDVGNKVITPAPGESFSDTIKRAAAYGKTVTRGQINQELASSPGKIGTVLGAAPAIGALGAAGLAGAGIAGKVGYPAAKVAAKGLDVWVKANPAKAAIAYELARQMGVPLPNVIKLLYNAAVGP